MTSSKNNMSSIVKAGISELQRTGQLTKKTLDEHFANRGRIPQIDSVFGTLIKSGSLSEDLVIETLINIQTAQKISDKIFVLATDLRAELSALSLLSRADAMREKILPIARDNNNKTITVIFPIIAPNNVIIKDKILAGLPAGFSLKPLISSEKELKRAIQESYRVEQEILQYSAQENQANKEKVEDSGPEDIVEESVERQMVDKLLTQAITDQASDIHFDQGEDHMSIRFRQDGILKYIADDIPKTLAPGIISRIKIMSGMDISEKRKPQDGRLSIIHHTRGKMDFRVSVIPAVTGEKVVMRILDNSSATLTLPELGFTPYNLGRFKEAYTKPSGLILVTGPTGSGKSTTLYATLNAVQSPKINIITVEDPVEYTIPRISQVQVNPKAGMTFDAALRSILRLDPDIILVGEIRDKETAKIAVEAAQTGHLVLSTLHTNDAPSSYERLINLGVDAFLVGNVTKAILAQRLARRLCNSCKVIANVTVEALASLGDFPLDLEQGMPVIYEASEKGCKECRGMGYRGRMGIHEILTHSMPLERTVASGANTPEIRDQAQEGGMLTLRQDGWYRVAQGDTSIAEILRVVA